MDNPQRYSVWCDGERIGDVSLQIPDDDSASGDLKPLPAFERVRSVLVRALAAELALTEHLARDRREGRLPSPTRPSTPDENHLTMGELSPADIERFGRANFEAIAAGQALPFELRDAAGDTVPGIDVQVHLREHPNGPQSAVPPMVVVWSGRWWSGHPAPEPNEPPSRPEA